MIKVLVVHQWPIMRAGLRVMLRAHDIRIVGEAEDIAGALRLVRKLEPHLVLVGPEDSRTNFALLQGVKRQSPKASVLLITPSEDPHDLSRALTLGCGGYLHARVASRELVKAVRAVGRGECTIEPSSLRRLLSEIHERADTTRTALTVPEREVLKRVTEGRTNREISQQLRCSVSTVKGHVQRIIGKLGVSDRTQAAVAAIRLGLFAD
jgi:DNA-binding NarL/FixJ family response regulator